MTTVGSVEFDVDFDGKTLPGEARKIGRLTAAQFNKSVNDALDKNFKSLTASLRSQMKLSGKESGSAYAKELNASIRRSRGGIVRALNSIFEDRSTFNNFVISAGSVEEGLQRIRDTLRQARDQGALTGQQFNRLNLISMNWAKSLEANKGAIREQIQAMRDAEQQAESLNRTNRDSVNVENDRASSLSRLTLAMKQFRVAVVGANEDSRTFFQRWKTLPSGFRRFTFFTGLFIALGSEIAALGSAAGSGLTVLAGAFGAAALGAGVAISAFQGLFGPLSELGPNAQIAQQGLRAIGDAFSALQDSIQEAVFANLGDDFAAIEALVRALEPALLTVASAINTVFAGFSQAIASEQGFADLRAIILGSAPVIEALGAAFIALGAAIGQILVVGQPFFLNFAQGLNGLFSQFNEFTRSLEGQNALVEWFQNGETIIGAVLPLLAAAGTVLNNLVNPETIALLVQALDNLTTFLLIGGQGILNFAALVDPIGLIAQALADLSVAIAPAGPVFEEIARTLNTVLSGAISELAPLIGDLVIAFAPLILSVVKVAGALLGALIPAITPLVNALVALAPSLVPIVEGLGEALLPVIEALGPVLSILAGEIVRLLEAGLPIILSIFTALSPVVVTLIEAIGPLLAAILPPLVSLILQLLEAIVPLIPLLLELVQPFLELVGPLANLIGPLLPPLIELLIFLVGFVLKPLIDVLRIGLVPAFEFVGGVIQNLFPLIDGLMQVLGGVLDFILGVFTGDWQRAWGGIEDIFKGVWNSIVGFVEASVRNMIDLINGLLKGISDLSAGVINIPRIPQLPRGAFDGVRLASGGFFDTPTRALIGEAGPEVVVPLSRPLNQVDPAVRELAAIARQLYGTGSRVEVSGLDRSGAYIAEGAITVISPYADPRNVAVAALDEIVERMG